jgi:hypothetical protein
MAIARTSWLRVTSGADAIQLLLSSERVFTDLQDWLRWGEPEQIVLRSWLPTMTYDYEFRVFVFENRITAISQYDHYTFYDFLKSEKKQLEIQVFLVLTRHYFSVKTMFLIPIFFICRVRLLQVGNCCTAQLACPIIVQISVLIRTTQQL